MHALQISRSSATNAAMAWGTRELPGNSHRTDGTGRVPTHHESQRHTDGFRICCGIPSWRHTLVLNNVPTRRQRSHKWGIAANCLCSRHLCRGLSSYLRHQRSTTSHVRLSAVRQSPMAGVLWDWPPMCTFPLGQHTHPPALILSSFCSRGGKDQHVCYTPQFCPTTSKGFTHGEKEDGREVKGTHKQRTSKNSTS